MKESLLPWRSERSREPPGHARLCVERRRSDTNTDRQSDEPRPIADKASQPLASFVPDRRCRRQLPSQELAVRRSRVRNRLMQAKQEISCASPMDYFWGLLRLDE